MMMKTHSSPQRRGRSEDFQSGFGYHVLSCGSVFSHVLGFKLSFRVKKVPHVQQHVWACRSFMI
jgi:hypothetical protein